MILAGKSQDSPAREFFVGGVPNTIKMLEERLKAATDDKTRETTQNQLEIQRNHLEGTNAVKPTPPNVTLTQNMTVYLGLAGSAAAVPRPRPHRRRRRRVPAAGTGRRHG